MSKSIIVIISIIILVIGISYGAYWYLNLPQVTAPVGEEKVKIGKVPVSLERPEQVTSWKTYQNKKYGYEVSYPTDWEYSLGFIGRLELYHITHKALPIEKSIVITPRRTIKTIDEYITDNLKNHEIESRQEIQISGGRGLKIESVANQRIYLSAYIKKGEFIYVFGSEILNKNIYPDVEKVFDAVLASVKFESFQNVPDQFLLEEQSLRNINDWSIYRNEYNGYLIKYPKYWCLRESSVTDVLFTSYSCDVNVDRPGLPKNEIAISISIPALGRDVTLDEWLTKVPIILEKQEILVGRVRAIRSKGQDPTFGTIHGAVRVIKDGVGYAFTYAPYDSELVNIFDQMLDSFEFIK